MTHPISKSTVKHGVFCVLLAIGCGCRGPVPTPQTEELVGRPAAAPSPEVANLWYHLQLNDDRLNVGLRLFAPPEQTKFFLPGTWAGRDDYANAIGITGASTSVGPAEVQLDRGRGELTVTSAQSEWVQLEYRLDLTPQSNFHAQLDHGVFVGFGPTMLVTPAQQILERTTQIPVELHVPAGFDVISTWQSVGSAPSQSSQSVDVHRFIAADGAELRDAFVVAGPQLRISDFGQNKTQIQVAFSPAFEGDTVAFANVVRSVTESYRQRFGNAGPVHAFVRTQSSAAGEFGGVGRRGGFILDVAPDTSLDDRARLLIAHEALHVWNGHLLEPEPAIEEDTRWFKEGVTHYIALKSMAASEAFVLEELAAIAANYSRNPLTRGASGSAIDRARLPYDQGALIALAMDAALARAPRPGGDVSCWLERLVRGEDLTYDEQQLLQAIQDCAGPAGDREIAQIWRGNVRSREPIELRTLFASVGLHWLPDRGARSARLVPLDGTAPHYKRLLRVSDD